MMLLGLCMCLGQLVVDHGASERVDTISSFFVSAQHLEHAEVGVCDDGCTNDSARNLAPSMMAL
jgi:hypothetical protein